jgi:ABC-2 type transport system ATP-binding protein
VWRNAIDLRERIRAIAVVLAHADHRTIAVHEQACFGEAARLRDDHGTFGPMAAIEVEGLSKSYRGRRGIVDVSFSVGEGVLFGFIGPNGAGKTTTIRILLGLLGADAGRARVFGVDVTSEGPQSRAGVGYVPSETNLYPRMRVSEVLDYLGRFHDGDHGARRRELVERLELDTSVRASELSLGNRKKVALVAALQHRPRLAILDEASTGLDPVMQARLHEILRDEVARGASVFFSSHVLSEVQSVCKQVAIVREGTLLAVEDIGALRARAVRRVRATFASDVPSIQLDGADQLERDGQTLTFLYAGAAPPLLEALARAAPTAVTIEEPSLDDIFLRYYVEPMRD